MSCIEVPHIGIPDIPGLSLLLGDISLTPSIGGNLCCKFELPIPAIIIPLGTLLYGLATVTSGGSNVDSLLATLDTIVKTINTLLDLLPFECPLN